mgnify:FL=1
MRTHKTSNYRPDIDGIRAIAVLSVVAFHAFPSLVPGGFVGVDIFFVISGFLITQIIVAELDSGNFKIRNFYSRRIRRIIPSLLVALVVALILGWILLLPEDFAQFGSVLAGSSVFITNFVLFAQVNYFDAAAVEKPLLHLWSLSIEEQFYIFWPVILIVIYRLRRFAFAISFVLLFTSFGYAYAIHGSHEELAFYSPLSRFWELLIGGLLAFIYLHHKEKLDLLNRFSFLPQLGSLVSLALIYYSLFETSTDQNLRAVTIGVVGSTGLIFFGYSNPFVSRVVGNPVSTWVGLISYPLYLWHWVFLSYAFIYFGGSPTNTVKFAAIGLSFLLAYLCYRYVELWMREKIHQWRKVGALIIGLIILGTSGFTIQQAAGFPDRTKDATNISQLKRVIGNDDSCFKLIGIDKPTFHYCRYNDVGSSRTIVFTGDSHVHASWQGITDYYNARGINTLMLANQLCPPFVGVATGFSTSKLDGCVKGTQEITDSISKIPGIDTVVFITRGSYYITGHELLPERKVMFRQWPAQLSEIPTTGERVDIFQSALQNTVDLYSGQGKKVFIVSENPELPFNVKSCANFGVPRAISSNYCLPQSKSEVLKRQKLARDIWKTIGNATYIDTLDLFCPTEKCNYLNSGTLLYSDDDHLSKVGSALQAERIGEFVN